MMSAIQKLKWLIVSKMLEMEGKDPLPYPCTNIDSIYTDNEEKGNLWDATNEICDTGIASNLEESPNPVPDSGYYREYSHTEVAKQLPDGSWVGWTYWYGGGRFDMPEFEPWVEHAYDLTKQTETKTIEVVVNTFKSGNMESTVTLL